MNTNLPTSTRHTKQWITIFICLCGAFALAWIGRKQVHQANQTAIISDVSAEKILDGLSSSTPNNILGNALAKTISKTRRSIDKPENWIEIGDLLAQLERDTGESGYYASAEAAYQYALKLKPDATAAMTGMAWVTGGRHQFDKSIEWVNQALKVDPASVAAYGILGDAEVELGDYDAAFENYQKMSDLRPDLSSWSRGAHLLWLMGKSNQAKTLMTKAINAGAPYAENTAWCRARLAIMLFSEGAFVPAESALLPALDADSKNIHVLLAAAKIAAAQKKYNMAANFYQSVLNGHSNQEALAGLGDLMAIQGKPKEAEEFYQKVEALHADQAKSGTHDHGFMAKFYADHDRNLLEALRMAEEHKLTKNVTEADTLAWVYYKNKLIPQAVAAMKRALSHKTPDAEMHYHAGLIAKAFGDYPAAKRHLEQSVGQNPDFSLLQAPIALRTLTDVTTTTNASN